MLFKPENLKIFGFHSNYSYLCTQNPSTMIHRILEDKVQALIGGKAILIMGAGTRIPSIFAKAYPDATYQIITPKNVDEFLL